MNRCSLVIGRFQGLTILHETLIRQSLETHEVTIKWEVEEPIETIVGIVCGEKSSKDKKKNFLTFVERVGMIRTVFPDIKCIRLPDAFIGNILDVLYGFNYNIIEICIGGDRYETYKKMLEEPKYFHPFPWRKINIRNIDRVENVSASQIRKAFVDNDLEEYKRLAPESLHRYFDRYRNLYLERTRE